jgi:preprotein translocase subunit SecE
MFTKLAEFFAEAKSEFKKISWPTRDEIKGSTAVVCVTIVFVMALLAFFDYAIAGLTDLVQRVFSK